MSQYTTQPAVRVTAAELQNVKHQVTIEEGDKSPNHFLLPSGGVANRAFVVGTITSADAIDPRGDQAFNSYLTDGTERLYFYAGQYDPEVTSKLRRMRDEGDFPYKVGLKLKLGTYEPEDEDEVRFSASPEEIIVYDDEEGHLVHDQWMYETVQATIDRLQMEPGDDIQNGNDLVKLAMENHETHREELKSELLEALEEFAG